MERKYREECQQIEKTYQEKSDIHLQEKNDYLAKMKTEIEGLKVQLSNRKRNYLANSTVILDTYQQKKLY